jgi:hypothetical protein
MATIFRLYMLLRKRVRVFESHAVPSAVRSRSGSSNAGALVETGFLACAIFSAMVRHAGEVTMAAKALSLRDRGHGPQIP